MLDVMHCPGIAKEQYQCIPNAYTHFLEDSD